MITPVIEEIENESSDSFTPEITLGQITQDIESEAIENSPETTSFEHYWDDCNNVPANKQKQVYPCCVSWCCTRFQSR